MLIPMLASVPEKVSLSALFFVVSTCGRSSLFPLGPATDTMSLSELPASPKNDMIVCLTFTPNAAEENADFSL